MVSRPDYWKRCTVACEATEICTECGRRKKPSGRDSRDNGLCDDDCVGYRRSPYPGHLWPGEIADMDAEPDNAGGDDE